MKPNPRSTRASTPAGRAAYARKRVYDPVVQALSGATDIQANRATGKPAMFRIIIADKVTSVTAAQAVTSALFYRERTGQGQHIKLSMLETMLAFFWPGFGEVRQAVPAAHFSLSRSAIRRPAPRLGEHSREILAGLGYAEDRPQTLIRTGVVGTA